MHIKTMFLSIMLLNILVGSLVANTVDASPELWSQTYGTPEGDYVHAMIETSDGGFALVGITRDDSGQNLNGLLIKTDALGTVEWNQTFPEIDHFFVRSITQTSDGGYAIVGRHQLVKVDMYGNIEWNQTYGKNRTECMVFTHDGGFAISGGNKLIKTDEYGEIEWTKTYSGGSTCYLIQTSDGGYALTGNTGSFEPLEPSDIWLGKTDPHGNLQWNITFGGLGNEFDGPLVETPDRGIAVLGRTNASRFGGGDLWLVKIDESGSIIWNQTYGSSSTHFLIKTFDGGFAIVGDNTLVKTDSYGVVEWNQTYGGANQEFFTSIVETSDRGYVLAGYLGSSNDVGKTDLWLIKTDARGIPEFSARTVLPLIGSIIVVVSISRRKLHKNVDNN